MVQKFPSTNLIALVLRQITQPLSKIIVKHVRKRPFVRKYILMQLGIFCYWCENKIKRRMISPPLTVTKRPLDDIRTMELGTRLLLEVKSIVHVHIITLSFIPIKFISVSIFPINNLTNYFNTK